MNQLDDGIGNTYVSAETGAIDVSSNNQSGGCDHVLLR